MKNPNFFIKSFFHEGITLLKNDHSVILDLLRMKQNQIGSLEIRLEPWSNQQQTNLFVRSQNNRLFALDTNTKKQNKPKRPNSQQKFQNKSSRSTLEAKNSISNNLRENYQQTLISLNEKQTSKLSYNVSNNKILPEHPVNPIGLKYYIRNIYSKVTLSKTNIEYFEDLEKVKKARSAGKSRRSVVLQQSPKQAYRPATSLSFFERKRQKQKSSPKISMSEMFGISLDPSPKKSTKQKDENDYIWGGKTTQFQKMLRLKEKLRQRNKINSQRKDQEREMNIRQKNGSITPNPEEEESTTEFEVALQTIQPTGQGQIQVIHTFQNAPICHERTVKMKYRTSRRLSSTPFSISFPQRAEK